ncbi:hypothetical protein RB195_000878 [Necator americanus]|uniref:TIL domain-containing protein n=1 Tax=Necator americanus TaxID=51031 RepID=A0ABR1DBS2_NECAM
MTMLRAGAKIWNEIFHMCVLSTFLFMESSSFTVLTSPRLCPPNEVYKSCGGCEPTCLTSKIPEACLAVCIVGCQCLPGFLRDSDGNCVSTCPGKPCGENEELKKQASTCEPTCADRNPICNKMAVLNVCRCKDGYIRDVTGGRCIPVEKCPTGCQVDTCLTIKCPPGTKCEQNTIFCIRAPCPQPPPQCVPITTVQPTTVIPPTSCEKIKCKPGEFCSVLFPLCQPDGPCPPPIARCYPRGGPEPV